MNGALLGDDLEAILVSHTAAMLPSKSHKHSMVYNNKPLFFSQTVGWAQGYSTFSLSQHGNHRSSRDQAKQHKPF